MRAHPTGSDPDPAPGPRRQAAALSDAHRTRTVASLATAALAASALILFIFLPSYASAAPTSSPSADSVIVKFLPGTQALTKSLAHRSSRAGSYKELPDIDVTVARPPRGSRPEALLTAYRKNPNVEYVELNEVGTVTEAVPNDPYYTNGGDWARNARLPEAWELSTGDAGVVVAYVDTGVKADHPDLVGRIVPGWDFVNGDADPNDDFGHGTKVAGVLGGAANNSLGIAGTTWSSPIMPVKACNSSGSCTSSAIAQSITYAADHGARVVSISLGTVGGSITVRSSIDDAISKGVVVVAAAGNEKAEVCFPAAYPEVVAVSAMSRDAETLAVFSNFGPEIDISAQGYVMTTHTGTYLGGYGSTHGTSLSTPIVAGSIALALSENPSLTPADIDTLIQGSAVDVGAAGRDDLFGWGRLDARRMVETASTMTASAPSPAPEPTPAVDSTPPTVQLTSPIGGSTISTQVTVTANASDETGMLEVDFYVDGSLLSSDDTAPFQATWNPGTAAGSHVVKAVAHDTSHNTSESATNVVVTLPALSYSFIGTVGAKGGPKEMSFWAKSDRNGVLDTTLNWDTARSNLDLYVYDASGALLGSSKLSKPERVVTAVSAGDYRISVVSATGKSAFQVSASVK